jgi:hypothetical protein
MMKPDLKPLQIDSDSTAAHSENIHFGLPSQKDTLLGRRFDGLAWRGIYAELMNERDPDRLQELAAVAERAILTRFQELAGDPGASEERQDLHNAGDVLRVLRKGELASPNEENKNTDGFQQFSSWLDRVRP